MPSTLLRLPVALCLVLLTTLAVAQKRKPAPKPTSPPAATAAPPTPVPAADSTEEAKRRARELFEHGLELSADEEWGPALSDYQASLQLYPTKAATKNAALCLRKLGRYDEALDALDSMRTFANLSELDRAFAEKQTQQILPFVGTLEVRDGEPGAALSIDGRDRGVLPLAGPLRVSAGAHVVRVFKAGFTPFESRVTVAGKGNEVVSARLTALARSGRLRVVEQTGKSVPVLVDNVAIGQTPWEGIVSTGDHTVLLRGEGNLGTQPASAPVSLDQLTPLTLRVEPLEAELRVDPVPVSSLVAVDGVSVGRGVWEGRLRGGAHRIEVGDEGFVPQSRSLSLQAGQKEVVALELKRDESSPLWQVSTPARIFIDARGGAALGLTYGGDLASACSGSCSKPLLFGEAARLTVGYELGIGLGFSLDAGYLWTRQNLSGRADTLNLLPTGSSLTDSGKSNDQLTLSGVALGASASWHTRSKVRWLFRLGAGVWLASATDTRSGQFVTSSSLSERPDGTHGPATPYPVGPLQQSPDAKYLYVAPEVRIAVPLGDHFEVGVGIEGWVVFALTQPTWNTSATQVLTGTCQPVVSPKCVSDGLATWPAQSLAGALFVLVSPGVGLRYTF